MPFEKIDLVVVGAGPAGLSAGIEVSKLGGRVVVLDECPVPGGRLPCQVHREPSSMLSFRPKWSNGREQSADLIRRAQKNGVRIVCGASVWDISAESDYNTDSRDWFIGVSPADPGLVRDRFPSGFQARSVLIATGAVQNPLPLSGWTLPGVLTAGAVQTLINVHQVKPGHRAMVVGFDPLAISAAQVMSAVGIDVLGPAAAPDNGLHPTPVSPEAALAMLAGLLEKAPSPLLSFIGSRGGKFVRPAAGILPKRKLKIGGVNFLFRKCIRAVHGSQRVEQVEVLSLTADGRIIPDSRELWPVDIVVTSAGLAPLTDLVREAGVPLVNAPELGGFVPLHGPNLDTPAPGLFVAGGITGIEGSAVAVAQGRLAGTAIAGRLGITDLENLPAELEAGRVRIEIARRNSLTFLPNINAGRTRMTRLWREHRM